MEEKKGPAETAEKCYELGKDDFEEWFRYVKELEDAINDESDDEQTIRRMSLSPRGSFCGEGIDHNVLSQKIAGLAMSKANTAPNSQKNKKHGHQKPKHGQHKSEHQKSEES